MICTTLGAATGTKIMNHIEWLAEHQHKNSYYVYVTSLRVSIYFARSLRNKLISVWESFLWNEILEKMM